MKRTKNIKKINFIRKLKLWINKGRNRNLLSEEIFYLFESKNFQIIDIECGYCRDITLPLFIIPKKDKKHNTTEQDLLRLKCNCEIPRNSKDVKKFNVKYA